MVESVDDLDLTPPKAAQENAQKVLDWRDEHGDDVKGMTRTGWVRANQLAKGEELSPDIVKRMAQFNRHRKNSDVAEENKGTPWQDAGRVSWLGWGGDEGVDWAMRMSERIDSIENSGRDKVTTLSHKHDSKTVENRNLVDNIMNQSSDTDVISKNTFNGYFQDAPEFQDGNWEDAVNRLSEVHGIVRSFITKIIRHEETGHGREENIPPFEEPVDTDTLKQFAENVDKNVEDDTYKDLVDQMVSVDEDVRKIFYDTVVHHNAMHGDGEMDVSQLLSMEMQEYDSMQACMDYHVNQEGYDADQAYAMCTDKMDLEQYENQDDPTNGDTVRWDSSGGNAYGRVETVERDGTVSAEPEGPDMEGTEDEPAYKVQVYEVEDGDWSGTDTYVVHRADSLTVIDDFPQERSNSKKLAEELPNQDEKVRWRAGGGNAYGRVEDTIEEGQYDSEIDGDITVEAPAALIEVYDIDSEGNWEPTDTMVAHQPGTLTVIEDFPQEKNNSQTLAEGIIPNHRPLGSFDTRESESWDRPSYSEFQSAHSLDENFAELDEDDKRLVAAHFGRLDNSSYGDATYSDLQLPHHYPDSGDVDRAAVIAARQRLPQSDMPQEDLEAIDTHLANHLRDDFDEEDVEPVIEKENAAERKHVYRDADKAVEKSRRMGIKGVHTMEEGGETLYRPGATPEDFEQARRENSDPLTEGQLVSFETEYGTSYGRVRGNSGQNYEVEVYIAELGGGYKSSGRTKSFEEKELKEEDKFPDSLDDVFNNGSTVGTSTVEEKESGELEQQEISDTDSDDSSEEVTQKLEPSKTQQVKKKFDK